MSWALFQIILVPVAKYIYDWRTIFLYFITIPSGLIAILNFFFIFESPRFLLTKEKRKTMYKTLNKIAKANLKDKVTEESCFIESL